MSWIGSEAQRAAVFTNLAKATAKWSALCAARRALREKCPACGGYKKMKSQHCKACAAKIHGRSRIRAWREAVNDWAGDPCSKCGTYPLTIYNRSGICRPCQRYEKRR